MSEFSQWIAAVKYQYSAEFVGPRAHNIVILDHSEIGCAENIRFTVDTYVDVEACTSGYEYEDEPKPKPPKGKPFIKQARRQSFRQVMRSVNRNR